MQDNIQELIFGDIQFDVRQEICSQHILITHFSKENISALKNNNGKTHFYMSQELYSLVQKLIKFGFLNKFELHSKIIPGEYPQTIVGTKVTIYKNDDSLFGSMAVIAYSNKIDKSIFYCHSYTENGAHKKRIKNWKKIIRNSDLDNIYFDKSMNSNEKLSVPNENSIQKAFTEFLLEATSSDAKVLFSPLNPTRLFRYNEIARQNGIDILWQEDFANLLLFFYPKIDLTLAYTNPQKTQVIKQVETKKKIVPTLVYTDYYIDPLLQNISTIEIPFNFKSLITPINNHQIIQLKKDLEIQTITFI